MVLRRYVFSLRRTEIDLSQVHGVSGNVARIWKQAYIFGNVNLSIFGRSADNVDGMFFEDCLWSFHIISSVLIYLGSLKITDIKNKERAESVFPLRRSCNHIPHTVKSV